ncbi:pyridoxal 5'-phosphate synthase glutaminase subunit PdxT [Candidatus Pyrohabitans sp.]
MKVGVLALQGDVAEHIAAMKRAVRGKGNVIAVKKPEQVGGLDALVIPGGESTTIGKLMQKYGIDKAVLAKPELAIFGTCAGAILLAKEIENYEQFSLKLMDISVARNAFGRQRESFEAELRIPQLGEKPFHAVFIRAPVITRAGGGVEVLARVNDAIVLARQGRYLACAFHPELTRDSRLHRYFIEEVAAP